MRGRTTPKARARRALVMSGSMLLLLAALTLAGALPSAVFASYLILSIVTFGTYALDKSASRRGGRRTAESTLHLLALSGGWPGALVAQQVLHHKSIKQPFRRIFWATTACNCLVLAVFLIASALSAAS